jgi:hypothetical protein
VPNKTQAEEETRCQREGIALAQARYKRVIWMDYWEFTAERLTEEELAAYAVSQGYAPGWGWYRQQERIARYGVAS